MSTRDPIPRQQLELVERQLAQTLRVFAAYSAINRGADKEASELLNAIVNRRSGFWNPTMLAFQSFLITGIYALVEQSPQVTTLATISNHLNRLNKSAVPDTIVSDLNAVRTRYVKYRHTLFGHSGKDQEIMAGKFEAQGFTWDTVQSDLSTLEYAFKVLWCINVSQPVPSVEESHRMHFPYEPSVKHTTVDTRALLVDLQDSE
jgi:hypothetical protein